MKFYGVGTVWDKELNKALCRFTDGEFETEDTRTAMALRELGYECDAEEPVTQSEPRPAEKLKPDYEKSNIHALRELARDAQIEGLWDMNKAELITALKAGD